MEFSDYDYLPLMKNHENLILGRTFSKVHSLAGLRIGYAFTPRWLPPWYNRAGTPFAVNSVSAAQLLQRFWISRMRNGTLRR